MSLAPQTLNVGDTVRVTVSFKYVVGVNTTVKVFAGPYSTNIFGKHMVGPCVGQADVSIAATSTPTPQTVDVDFILIPEANGGIDNGTYGLRVWVEDTNAVVEQDNVIIVAGNPDGGMFDISGMLPMVMMMVMLGMVMPMVGEGMEE